MIPYRFGAASNRRRAKPFSKSDAIPKPVNTPPNAGFPLPVAYLVWVIAIVILTPVVARYADIRARRGGVLRYL